MSQTLEATLNFAMELINVPYEWWNPGECMITDDAPFWAFNNPVPSVDRIKSSNCAGLINLLRRFNNLEIPGVRENNFNSGGTHKWSKYLDKVKTQFDPNIKYPSGTLLLRDFRDITDQGHLAIIYNDDNILHSRSSKGICIEAYEVVYKVFKFEYAISHENWLK